MTDCLHRQRSYTGRVQEIGSGTCYRPNIPSRFCDKQTKTCPGTYSGHRIPWVLSELRTGKVNKIRVETRHLLEDNQITARKLSQLLGRLQAATRAESLAPLFYRKLQQALQVVLEQSNQDYSAKLILSTGEQEELQWWLDRQLASSPGLSQILFHSRGEKLVLHCCRIQSGSGLETRLATKLLIKR